MKKKINICLLIAFIMVPYSHLQAQSYDELSNKVMVYFLLGDYKTAIVYGEKAVIQAKKEFGDKDSNYATSVENLAILYDEMGQNEKAVPLYKEAMKIRREVFGEKHPDYITSLSKLAFLYDAMGQYAKAEPLYIELMKFRREVLGEKHPDYATSLSWLASIYNAMGQYARAEPLFIESMKIRKEVLGEKHPDYAASLNNLALLYEAMGQYGKAEPLLLKALEIVKVVLGEKHSKYATALNNLAFLYDKMGQYEKAEPLYIESMKIRKEIFGEKHPDYASSLNNLAILYYEMGQYEKAESMYKEAINIDKEVLGEKHLNYAGDLVNFAEFYREMGHYKTAEPMYKKAMNIYKDVFGEKNPVYATVLNNLAILYEDMGQYEKSEPLYIESMKIRREVLGENHPDYAISLNNLALLYCDMKQYEKAEPLYKEAINIDKEVLGEKHPEYVISLNNLANLYQDIGQYEKAEPLYKEGNKNLLNQLKTYYPSLSEKEKLQFIETIDYHFEIFYSFGLKRNIKNPSIACDMSDLRLATKGLILSSTSSIKSRILNSGDNSIIELYDKLTTLRSQISYIYTLTLEEQNKRGLNLTDLESQANDIEKELGKSPEIFKTEIEERTITWKNIQEQLQPDEAAVEFIDFHYYDKRWTDTTYYYALIIRPDYKYPKLEKLTTEKELGKFFEEPSENRGSYINNKTKRTELCNLVWSPLSTNLANVKKIYISPSGLLNKVSFSALAPSESELLLDNYDIRYVTNLKDIVLNKEKLNIVNKEFNVSVFGGAIFDADSSSMYSSIQELKRGVGIVFDTTLTEPPQKSYNYLKENTTFGFLKGTLDEADKISGVFTASNWKVNEFTGFNASEDALKLLNYKNSPAVLHIASHGFFFPEPPKDYNKLEIKSNVFKISDNPLLRSGIVLSGANRVWQGGQPVSGIEDGIVTAYEVSNLDLLNTELVVLSACETGLGDIKGGEGVFGLQRAFKTAGVKSIIMSLWKVPDKQTVELMEIFYRNWLSGMAKHEAFTAAQREMRKKYEPYFWAAFVMVE